MKYVYENMSIDDICDIYDQMFFPPFTVNWDDKLSSHRQEIIDCIESGVPQNPLTIGAGVPSPPGTPGVDYAL